MAKPTPEVAISAIRGKVTNHNCPRCGTDDWSASVEYIFVCESWPIDLMRDAPSALPSLLVCCKSCGLMLTHNLKVLGVTKEER